MTGSLEFVDLDRPALRECIAQEFERTRRRIHSLADAVDDDDLTRQHSPLMSPLVWDLAHVGNQEDQWLVRDVGGAAPLAGPTIDDLYDMFKHPRAVRPQLPLLSPAESRRYIGQVRDHALRTLDASPLSGSPLVEHGFIYGMTLQHEQQHAETMLATHQLRMGAPALAAPPPPPARVDPARMPAEALVPGGPFTMGTDVEPWALDNERPAHQVVLQPFWIDVFPVTNAAYQRFVEAGGYSDPRWWTPQGWARCHAEGLAAPQFWERRGSDVVRWRFGRVEPIPPDEPVQHVCWFEADAYARWAGKRLPTEAEWEKAARWNPARGAMQRYPWGDSDPDPSVANLGGKHLQPAPAGAYPAGASPLGVHQLIGDVWEWTSSWFAGYPGFVPFPYDNYSAVFFGRRFTVLRGGSWAADPLACRGTFRNWDYRIRRQIFAGFRCARDAAPDEA